MNTTLTKSIYLIGPQSTGKTTLGNALLDYYGHDTPHIEETARKILAEKLYTASDLNSNKCLQMQMDIFEAHFKEEMHMFIQQNFCYISDRSAVDPIIYAQKYAPDPNDWKMLSSSDAWKILSARYKDKKSCIIILLEPIKNFLVNDGTRKMPKNWTEMEELTNGFKEFLQHEEIPFYTLGENCCELKERVQQVVSWVNNN